MCHCDSRDGQGRSQCPRSDEIMTYGMMCTYQKLRQSGEGTSAGDWWSRKTPWRRYNPENNAADYVCDFKVFMAKVKSGTFSALNVSFENANQVLELSTPTCSKLALLIDYGLEASVSFDIIRQWCWQTCRETQGNEAIHCPLQILGRPLSSTRRQRTS